jgi:hypothetical protein
MIPTALPPTWRAAQILSLTQPLTGVLRFEEDITAQIALLTTHHTITKLILVVLKF